MKLYIKIRCTGSIVGYRGDCVNEEITVRDLAHARQVVAESNYSDNDMQNQVVSAVVYPGKVKLV